MQPKKYLLFIVGLSTLILGITMILAWWPHVVSLFKGMAGVCIALAGMIILYLVRE